MTKKSLKELAMSLLDDEDGISLDAWNKLFVHLVKANLDRVSWYVRLQDGRAYIPEDKVKDAFK